MGIVRTAGLDILVSLSLLVFVVFLIMQKIPGQRIFLLLLLLTAVSFSPILPIFTIHPYPEG